MNHASVTRRAVVAGGCGFAAVTALAACAGYGAGGPVTGSAPSGVPNEAAGTAGGAASGAAAARRVPPRVAPKRSPPSRTCPSGAASSSPRRIWS